MSKIYDFIGESIKKHPNAKYANLIYGSNETNRGLLSNSPIVSVNEINNLALSIAIHNGVLYKMGGMGNLNPDLGTLMDITSSLKSWDVSQLRVYDTSTGDAEWVRDYLIHNGIADTGKGAWDNLLTKINSLITTSLTGNAQLAHDDNGDTIVSVPVSAELKKYLSYVYKVINQNPNIVLTTIDNVSIDFDKIEEFISNELPTKMEELVKTYFPNVESFNYITPTGLSQAVINNDCKYLTIAFMQILGSGYDWVPIVVFTSKKVNSVYVDPNWGTHKFINIDFENSQSANVVFVGECGESPSTYGNFLVFNANTDTNITFNYEPNTEGSVQTTTGYTTRTTSLFTTAKYGYLWNDTVNHYSNNALNKILAPTMNNSEGDSYELTKSINIPLPTNPTYSDKAKYKLTTSLIDAGYIDRDVQWGYAIGNTGDTFGQNFNTYIGNNYKYLSLYVIEGDNYILPLILLSLEPISSVNITVAEFNDSFDQSTITVSFPEGVTSNFAIYKEQSGYLMPSGAIPYKQKFLAGYYSRCSASYNWMVISNVNQWTANNNHWRISRTGDAWGNCNRWDAGEFVGKPCVEIFKNLDVSTYTPSAGSTDPVQGRIRDSVLFDNMQLMSDYVIYSDSSISQWLEDNLDIEDTSELFNIVPVDTNDDTSLVDTTQSIDDVVNNIQQVNDDSGISKAIKMPIKYANSTDINVFSTLFAFSSSDSGAKAKLKNISKAFYSTNWVDSVLQKWTGNPADGIISLAAYPFSLQTIQSETEYPVQVFGKQITLNDTPITTKIILSNKILIDFGSIKLSDISSSNSFRDYEPYSKLDVYLPFVGVVTLNLNDVLANGYIEDAVLKLTYTVELVTGTAVIRLFITKSAPNNTSIVDYDVFVTTANIATFLPCGAGAFATMTSAIISIASGGLGAIGGAIAGGGVGGAVAGALGNTMGNLANTNNRQTKISGGNGNSWLFANLAPYLILYTHDTSENYEDPNYVNSVGLPANRVAKISEIGSNVYVEADGFNIQKLDMTAEEQQALSDILKTGFWT